MDMSLYGNQLSFLQIKYMRVRWEGCVVALTFKKLKTCFPQFLNHFTFPPAKCNSGQGAHLTCSAFGFFVFVFVFFLRLICLYFICMSVFPACIFYITCMPSVLGDQKKENAIASCHVGSGNLPGSSARPDSVLNHWAISLASVNTVIFIQYFSNVQW